MNFGQAIELMKEGKRLQRIGWHKEMFVYYVAGGNYSVQMAAIKQYGDDENKVKYNPYLAMKNMDNSISMWVPSLHECLADDWQVCE